VQATLELRRRGCKIPIVAMTANVSDRDRATCHDSGMDGFLSKPILKGRLGRAIRQVIASGTLFPPSMLAEQAARRAKQQEQQSSSSGAEGEG
jgi:two-component system, sensor histidine kinase